MKERLLHLVRSDPAQWKIAQTRWRLSDLGETVEAFQSLTLSGLSRILARLGIGYKRGRDQIRSPDPLYRAKLEAILNRLQEAREQPEAVRLLFLDEMSYYRQPTLALAWEAQGRAQPLARRSHASDTVTRVIGTLDPLAGRVVWQQRTKIGLGALVSFYRHLSASYPSFQRLYLVVDNWPVHFHPDVLAALEPQESSFEFRIPPSWPTTASAAAQSKWGGLQLPIQLCPLPTYAPWANPIEKLWRYLRQSILHLHRQSDELEKLRERVGGFLDTFAVGSKSLLRYVGLSDLDRLYRFL